MKKISCQKFKCQSKGLKKEGKRITFELDKSGLQCFISKQVQPRKNKIQEPKISKLEEVLSKAPLDKNLRLPFSRAKASSFVSTSYNSFNNQVLFLQYGKDDVYVDTTKVEGQNKSKTPSPNHNQGQQQQYDFQTPCVRVITQDTDNTSNPITTRFSTPEMISQSSRAYSITYNDQFYYPNIPPRNKRAISSQESKAYVIDLDKIQEDGRSTIMVRNIPNKYTQQMLIKLFSENHRIKFDFFYLPMDYKNNCNIGYAFLNFIHAKFIKDFYLQFHGKTWQKFNSEKICNICYARIQGKAQLSYHFEHSKVIQQKDKKGKPLGLNENFIADIQLLLVQQRKKQI